MRLFAQTSVQLVETIQSTSLHKTRVMKDHDFAFSYALSYGTCILSCSSLWAIPQVLESSRGNYSYGKKLTTTFILCSSVLERDVIVNW